MATIFSTSRLSALLTLDTSRFLAGTKLAENAIFRLGNVMQTFGRNLIRGPLVALGFLSAQAIKTAAEFDELTAQLRAVTGGGGIERLTENARYLGRTTKFTATEIQNLQVELSKLGFGTDAIIGAVANAANITQVFGGSLVKTGNTIAEITRQFSRENLSASRVADVMAVAFSKTALSTDNFAQAMKNVGSIANITNNGFVDTVTLLGLLANAGQKSGIAGTRLKGVLIRLSKELGVTGTEIDFLLNGQLTFNELIEFFRNRAGVAAAVIGEMGEEFATLRRQIDDSNGAAESFAGTVEDRLFFNIDRLAAATEDASITFGTSFEPIISRLADTVESFADSFAKADPGLKRFVANFSVLLVTLPAFVFVFGGILKAVAALGFGLGQVALAIYLFTAAFARGLTVYASTNLLMKKTQESTEGLLSSLDKKKVDNVKNLEDRIGALRSELEKLSKSEGIDADILATATDNFTSEIERLESKLKGIDQFSFADTIARIEEVRRKQILFGREGTDLRSKQLKLEQQILEARRKQFAAGGDVSVLGRAVSDVKAQLEQELEFVNLEIGFRKLKLKNFDQAVEDLKNELVTADLSFLNIPQLEAELIKYRELLDDAISATTNYDKSLDQVTRDDFFGYLDSQLRLAEVGLARTFGQGDWREGLLLLQNLVAGNAVSLGLMNAEAEHSVTSVNFLNEMVGNFTDELERQNAALDAVVASYGDFGDKQGVLGAGESLADLFEEIRKVTAAFGEQTNKLDEASVVISQYATNLEDAYAVADLLQKIRTDGFDLGSIFDLRKVGGLDAQLEFVKGLTRAFRDLAVERLAEGQRTLAARANEAADALEVQLKFLEGIKRRADIRKTVKDTEDLNSSLRLLGQIDEIRELEGNLSTLRQQLREALINPEDSKLADDLLNDLTEVENRLDRLTGRKSLNAILDRDVANQLTINAAKVAKGFGSLGDSYASAVSLEEGRVLDLLDEKDAGNTQVTAQVIAEAIQRLLEALDAQKVYEFNEAIQDFKDSSKDAASAFTESLKFGEFSSDIDAYSAAINVLKQRIQDAKALLKASGDTEDGFLSKAIDLDTQKLRELQDELKRLQFGEALVQTLRQSFLRLGDELLRAQEAGEDFGEVLIQTLQRVFKELATRLAALTAAFIVLSAFGLPVGTFGSFLAKGFGLPTTGGATSGGIDSLLDTFNTGVKVEGSISGNNIVLANQRGTRAYDRTFG
jgi:uncharacterized small protein (DUF1192 family)